MKILSLIVPSYNSERFLDKVIGSFLHEAVLDKLDIILVNDGSTDGTAEIAAGWAEKYPGSIRLISQENKGHGGALNTGCAAAAGKYLKVIDADDWVQTENLPPFIGFLENCDSDVVLTHHRTIDITSGEIKNWKSYPKEAGRAYSLEEIMADWKSFDRSLTFHGITYRREFYRQYGIRLSEHVFYEDHEFATYPCCMARSVTPLDLFIYEYRVGDVTQSVSNENQLKRIGHTETVLRRLAAEFYRLPEEVTDGGRDYICMKIQGLLMSYLTTSMLVNPDKKAGRKQAAEMMAFIRKEVPGAYEKAKKQYGIYCLMNRLHINRDTFEAVLHSKLYNRLRNNHDFN